MEDEKLAAYYDELTRKGGGAARFKQGLGFTSSANDDVPSRGSALPTSASSFLSGFVKASSSSKSSELEKQAQLQSIQNKLSKTPHEKIRNRELRCRSKSRSGSRNRHPRHRSSSPSRDRHSRRKSRSRSRSRDRHSRHRSSSCSRDRYSRRRSTSRDRVSRQRSGERSKRSGSPERGKKQTEVRNGGRKEGGINFAKLIEGYDHMTPAERVKAKMKLQLLKTAENDETMGKESGWERFDFNMDAPLDDEEVEAGEDDAVLVAFVFPLFRCKEEEIKAAHDEAMFGASSFPLPAESNDESEDRPQKETVETTPARNLHSDQVLTMQRGSWRDRALKHELYGNNVVLHKRDLAERSIYTSNFLLLFCFLFKYKFLPSQHVNSANFLGPS